MLASSFSLENFRTFEDQTTLELAPITILTGPNSSGKSSVLKALLLLKESAKRHGLARLDFAGGGHNLGSFQSVKSHESNDAHLRFGLSFPSVVETARGASIFSLDSPPSEYLLPIPADRAEGRVKEIATQIQLSLQFESDGLKRVDIRAGETGAFETVISVFRGVGDYEWERPAQLVTEVQEPGNIPSGYIGIVVNGPWIKTRIETRRDLFEEQMGSEAEGVDSGEFDNYLSSNFTFTDHGSVRLTELASLFKGGVHQYDEETDTIETGAFEAYDIVFKRLLYPFVKETTEAFLDVLRSEKITHLSALREGVNQIYLEESTPSGFTRLLRKAVDNKALLREKQDWLEVFNIGDQINVERVADAGYVISARRDGRDYPVSSLGFGVSQILPLIMYLQMETASDSPQMLLLEEPEANLHPNLQARLADLFVDLTMQEPIENDQQDEEIPADRNSRTGLLVETHSEYLIRRLQYLVATDEVASADVRIYYLGPDPESDDYIRKIDIDPNGQLSQSFGPGFFDEATNLMTDLYKKAQ